VRRLALFLLVGLLSSTLSGGFSLIVPEPCGTDEGAGTTHATCPPTCLRCGCCRQPVIPALHLIVLSGVIDTDNPPAIERRVVSVDPADIFHVPKRSAA
jgi:hypothetical protein